MRKPVGWLLLFLGAFLLMTAILGLAWLPGAMQRTPLNVDSYTYLSGEGDKLDPATGELVQVPVKALSRTKVDKDKSDGDVVVFVNTTCANIDENSPDDCLEDDDERLISNGIDVFAADRHTGMAVNDEKYLPADATEHDGLQNKSSFDTKKKSYPWWDGMLERTVDADFVGEKEIDGLKTYEFHMVSTDEPATVVGDLQGTYSMDKTMWIEPVTGAIIDQEQHEVRKLDDGSTILDLSLSFTDETVAANVKDGKANSGKIKTLGGVVPPLAGALGLIATLAGGFLVLRGRREDKTAA